MPSSARGWLNFAVSVRERHERPHSPKYEYEGFTDRRLGDLRETAISVVMFAEKASKKCSGNSVGLDLMRRYYVEEYSWFAFNPREQAIIAKTARDFSRRLREAGFIRDRGEGARDEETVDPGRF